MREILTAYLVTFGWAIVGSISMGIGIIITLKLFDISTRKVDEWELIKHRNIPMSIILASVIIALGIVVAAAIHPYHRIRAGRLPGSFPPSSDAALVWP